MKGHELADELERVIEERLKMKRSLQHQIEGINNSITDANTQIRKLDNDYHALIPLEYNTHSKWQETACDSDKKHFPFRNIYPNRAIARECQLSCNTYQHSYHVIKLPESEIIKYGDELKVKMEKMCKDLKF